EQTGEPTVVGERATGVVSKKSAAKFSDHISFRSIRHRFKNCPVEISAFERRGNDAPVSVPQFFGLERINGGIIPTFFNHSPQILFGKQQQNDWAERIRRSGGRSAYDLTRKLPLVVDEKLRVQLERYSANIDVVKVRGQSETMQ